MPHTRDMNKNENSEILSAFGALVGAYTSGDPDEIAEANAAFDAVAPARVYSWEDEFVDGDSDYFIEASDREYDYTADRYERNWK